MDFFAKCYGKSKEKKPKKKKQTNTAQTKQTTCHHLWYFGIGAYLQELSFIIKLQT